MRWVAQKLDTRLHALQDSTTPFDPQVRFHSASVSDESDARLAAVSIQVIHDQSEASVWIRTNDVVQVFKEVLLGPRFTKQRRDDLPGRNMQITEQSSRSVTSILIFAFRNLAGRTK